MVRFAAIAFALAITSLGSTAQGAGEILLLDFWSPQCGPCMQMKPTMHAFEEAKYPIREVDTTRDSETARQFGITQIPCFVMLVDNQEIDRHVGPIGTEELTQMFEKAKDLVIQRRRARGQSTDQPQPPAGGRPTASGPAPAPRLDGNVPNTVPQRDPWTETAGSTSNPAGAQQPRTQLPVAEAPVSSGDFPQTLISSTVRIRVDEAQARSFGTGTIIDVRSGEALIATCGHLFRESKGKGPMTVELFEATPAGPKVVGSVPGQLISYDLDREVAFVSIRPNRQISAARVAPPRTKIDRGDRVASIGCSNGNDPTLAPSRITTLDRYQGAANIEVSGAPEEGRSGGGLFNSQGELIGVCYAADYEGKEGLYAALESIHEELHRLQLDDVYTNTPGAAIAANQPTIVRGQVLENPPNPPITPLGSSNPPAAADKPKTPNLNPSEQAAYEEIMRRAGTSEVVVIVRPKTPGGQSDVITLDNVSPEFVRALAERQRSVQPTATK